MTLSRVFHLQVLLLEQGTAFTGSTTLHPNQTATFINVLLSRPPKSPPGEGFNSKLPAMPSNNLHKLSSSIWGTQASLLIYWCLHKKLLMYIHLVSTRSETLCQTSWKACGSVWKKDFSAWDGQHNNPKSIISRTTRRQHYKEPQRCLSERHWEGWAEI